MTALLRRLTRFLNRLEMNLRLQSEKLERYNDRLKQDIEEEKRPKPYAKRMF